MKVIVSMNDLVDFRNLVKDLVLNKNIPHATLIKEMRNVLTQEASKLPKVRLLKCDSYGGYDLSNVFKRWLGYDNPDINYEGKEFRIRHAQDMKDFGAYCVENHPFIAKLVHRYEKSNVTNTPDYKEYLTGFRNFATLRKDNVMHSFEDAISHYGEENAETWKYQQYFDYVTMRYIIEHPSDADEDSDADNEDEAFLEKIGLLFASTEYCRLGFAKIPQIIDWYIEEYDGLEGIRIL